MIRPVFFDASYLIARISCPIADGFTNVNLAYARHFIGTGRDFLVRSSRRQPTILSQKSADRVVTLLDQAILRNDELTDSSDFRLLRNRLLHGAAKTVRPRMANRLGSAFSTLVQNQSSKLSSSLIGSRGTGATVAEGAIYLDVSQYRFEYPHRFRWLESRPDVRPVFLLHDLLPIEYPEFFVPGESDRFERRLQMAFIHGRGLIVTTQDVGQRVAEAMERLRRPPVPIHVAPFPSPLAQFNSAALRDDRLAEVPYFVMVATIEPRKNHLLLLSIWRQLAQSAEAAGRPVPKLVLVGRRRHENEQILDVLDRGRLTQPHIHEVAHLAPADLARLIANARALLMPSFAEGYGLPLVEALTLGTPVIATDAPVFREVTQGCAIYRSPIDGVGWSNAVESLVEPDTPASLEARFLASRFRPVAWTDYFDDIRRFLTSL